MIKRKPTVGIILASIAILGINSNTPAQSDFFEPEVQRFSVPSEPVLLIPNEASHQAISRMREVKIEETRPQDKPHNASLVLTNSELIAILREAGFSGYGLKMAWAIVQKESTARPFAHNDNADTGDNSYGLFQINMRGSMGPDRREKYDLESNNDLFDPLTNAKIAFKMSGGGEAWGAWTTYQKAQQIVSQFPE